MIEFDRQILRGYRYPHGSVFWLGDVVVFSLAGKEPRCPFIQCLEPVIASFKGPEWLKLVALEDRASKRFAVIETEHMAIAVHLIPDMQIMADHALDLHGGYLFGVIP